MKELKQIQNEIQIEIMKDSIQYVELNEDGEIIMMVSRVMKASDFQGE
jgi:hypothetical protein